MSTALPFDSRSKSDVIDAIFQNLAEGVVACDANGVLTHFNQAARDFHGVSESLLPPSEWSAHYGLFHADGVTPLKTEEIPLIRALSGETVRDLEIVIKTPQRALHVLCSGHSIMSPENVKLGAVIAMRDISDSKKAAAEHLKALSESEKRFRTLFEQSPLSVQLLSVDGRTLQVNDAWKKLWSVDDKFVNEVMLTNYRILEDPQLVEKGILPFIQSAFAGKGAKIPAIQYVPSETAPIGRARWVEGFVEPIFDEKGEVREVVLIHQDVTQSVTFELELKTAKDAAEEASRLKTSFLANMSHEIRTPLSAVLGFSHLLKSRALSAEDAANYANVIDRNGQALMQIIEDVLDLSKIEAGRLKLEVTFCDLEDLLRDIGRVFKMQVADRNFVLMIDSVPEEARYLYTDGARLRQILVNLIGNAVKFTTEGEVRVRTRISADRLEISVTDTGLGIDAQAREQLFKPFHQVDNSSTRRFGGTGLGLALSKRLAQALEGDVSLAWSELGVGSTFLVRLPFHPASQAEKKTASGEAEARMGHAELDAVRILLVDDSEDNRHYVGHVLSKRGALLTFAGDGLEAVELASSQAFDVILMDVQMPFIDGHEATRRLRAQGNRTPIIALTAHAMLEEKERSLLAGANAHVTKPVQIDILLETIRSLLGF